MMVTFPSCFISFFYFHMLHMITVGIDLHTTILSFGVVAIVHHVIIICCKFMCSISFSLKIAKCLHSLSMMSVVGNKCFTISCFFSSQHQHVEKILIFILIRLPSMEIFLFQAFHVKISLKKKFFYSYLLVFILFLLLIP